MGNPVSSALLMAITFITGAQDRRTATVVDAGGTETKLVDVSTSEDEFGGRSMGASGVRIVMKDFRPGAASGAALARWIYLDEIERLEIKRDSGLSPDSVVAQLKSGETISGSFGRDAPNQFDLRGKSDLGDFSLGSHNVRSITMAGMPSKPQPEVVETQGAKATITLRDGTVMSAEDVSRNCIFPRVYINVDPRSEHYSSIWITFKRGEASIETELPFERMREISFDIPVVTRSSWSTGSSVKVTLRDGSNLSGFCGGSGPERRCTRLTGRAEGRHFEIVGGLGYAIKTIQFAP